MIQSMWRVYLTIPGYRGCFHIFRTISGKHNYGLKCGDYFFFNIQSDNPVSLQEIFTLISMLKMLSVKFTDVLISIVFQQFCRFHKLWWICTEKELFSIDEMQPSPLSGDIGGIC